MKRQKAKVKSIKYGMILFVMLLMLTAGCARTVTPLFPMGKTISLEVNFKEALDTSANKYFIVLHTGSSPQIPFIPLEFIEPGDTPSRTGTDYVATYYSTWSDYLALEGNTIYLALGPFVTTEAGTKDAIATWTGSESKMIRVSFDLDRLNLLPASNILYFDFVTVDRLTRTVKDNLSAINSGVSTQYIDTSYVGTYVSGIDEQTSGISGALDIMSWNVTIQ